MKIASFREPIRIGEDFADNKIGITYPYRVQKSNISKDYDVVKITN
jgi:hypothetical protein